MFSSNGTPPAPRSASGAFVSQRAKTEFLPDLPADTWLAVLYHLGRQQFAAITLLRWISIALLLVTVAWIVGSLPGGWSVATLWAVALVLLFFAFQVGDRRSFVDFAPATLPPTVPASLSATRKIPVYVTGVLSVENKLRRFTALPGYYRTFATREHALLCLARARRFARLGAWPGDEEGLWYAFIAADRVEAIAAGQLQFGRSRLPALAITYRPAPRTDGKHTHEFSPETVYLAFVQESDRQSVLDDLMVDRVEDRSLV